MDTKKEMLAKLEASGEIHRYKDTPNWRDAFTAFQLATGETLGLRCSKCYKRVVRWLKK